MSELPIRCGVANQERGTGKVKRDKALGEMGHKELVLWLRDLCNLYHFELCNLSTGIGEIEEELTNTMIILMQSLKEER